MRTDESERARGQAATAGAAARRTAGRATACLAGAALAGAAALAGEALARRLEPGAALRRPEVMYMPAAGLGYRLAGGIDGTVATGERVVHFRTDARGRRSGPAATPAAPDACRVLAVGDSFTLGLAVDYEALFTTRTGAALAQRHGHSVQVTNVSAEGYGPGQYYRAVIDETARAGYDAVLVFVYVGNDPLARLTTWRPAGFTVERAAGRAGRSSPWYERVRGSARRWSARSAMVTITLGRLLEWRLRTGRVAAESLAVFDAARFTRKAAEPLAQLLAALQTAATSDGGRFGVVLIPPDTVASDARWDALSRSGAARLDRFHPGRLLADALGGHGVRVIDPTERLMAANRRGAPTHGRRDRHLSPAGHAVIARVVADARRDWCTGRPDAGNDRVEDERGRGGGDDGGH